MPIIAMKTTAARAHENADTLRVYTFEAPGFDPTIVVANNTATYEVGDVVAIALVGTILSDGMNDLEIKKMKVRGVLSFGMAVGKRSEPVGTNLTETLGGRDVEVKDLSAEGVVEESVWPRYTSLPGFLAVKDEILAVPEVVVTEKLHGSNARFGFHGRRSLMYGTHTSRIVEDRMDPTTWPAGHLITKFLTWAQEQDIAGRIERIRKAHPEYTSLAVYGETYGFKCSDLHYGLTGSEVRLFADVNINGVWLGYEEAIEFISGSLFPERPVTDVLVPILYRGKPDPLLLKQLRDQPSDRAKRAGGQTQVSEGVVIRPTTERFSEVSKDRLIAKYKSPLYEERKSLRDADPTVLPTYVTAYDLLADFVTEERIRHVLAKAEASGVGIEKRNIRTFGDMLFADIQKESVGEWPPGSETLDQRVLSRWTFALAGEMIAKAIESRTT